MEEGDKMKHPNHKSRINFLRNRFKKCRTEDEIIEEIKLLGWEDFSEIVARHQIRLFCGTIGGNK